jgi:tetratricopeptide (TPR) repeat protein
MTEDELGELERLVVLLHPMVDQDPQQAATTIVEAAGEMYGDPPGPLSGPAAAVGLMNSAGILIDSAARLHDVGLLEIGEAWAQLAVDSGYLADRGASAALYNLANARIAIADERSAEAWRAADPDRRAPASSLARWDERERLLRARAEFAAVAAAADDVDDLGQVLCNLANTFDHSGRWIEAYDAYVRALEADPTNGNAAGNAAVLIQRVIRSGWDFEGHLCSLYDRYLEQAKANRVRTVEVAGEGAARLFDALDPLGSDEDVRTEWQEVDPYQAWVAKHRLALVAGLEGLGSGDVAGRFDTISLRQVTQQLDEEGMPIIFSVLNILKGDYLVARRLAYEACQVEQETGGWSQMIDDPGEYVETLEYAVVGELSAKLVLAHRAALDVLDKTAVAVNEHFKIGANPASVSFRRFWFDDGKNQTVLRADLLKFPEITTAVLSMAELALDMAKDGIYGHAQDVRNAGTHRFVLVHHGLKDVKSTESMKAITFEAMVSTVMQSLTVARAAYLYLVAMVAVHEAAKGQSSGPGVVLPVLKSM